MKALIDVCTTIKEFPPGHYLDSRSPEPVRYYEPGWRDFDSVQCSTPTAIRWDAMFEGRADPSGRAVAGVHQDAYYRLVDGNLVWRSAIGKTKSCAICRG